jgi:hypothetical protein
LGKDQFVPSKPPAKKALTSQVEDSLLYRNYSQSVNFNPISLAGIGLSAQIHLLSPEDGLITSDPNRSHATAVLKAQGKTVTWAETKGAVRPHVGAGYAQPAGPVDFHVGAWADSEIGLSVLAPYAQSTAGATQAAKNMTVDFPFSAEKAKQLVEGSEAVMMGRGTVSTGVGVGYHPVGTALPLGYGVGVSASVDQSAFLQGELNVRVKRLYGPYVHVMVSRIETTGENTSAGVQAGLTTTPKHAAIVNSHVGGSQVAKTTEGFLDRQVMSWLKFDAHAVYSRSDSEKAVKAYVLDLSNPAAAEAYEKLLRLDSGAADELAAQPNGPVVKAKLDEETHSTRDGVEANFAHVPLVSDYTTRSVTKGTLDSPRGSFDYQIGAQDRNHSDILTRWWSGRVDTNREFIQTSGRSQSLPSQLYHVRYEANIDGNTTSGKVQRFLTAAGYLVGKDAVDKAKATDPNLLDRFWRSRMTIDAAIKPEGVQRLLTASPGELKAAYAAAYEELDNPTDFGILSSSDAWKTTPWLNASSPDYPEVMELLERDSSNSFPNDERNGQNDSSRYWQLTGRSLANDQEAYRESNHLVALFQALGKTTSTDERSKILAKADGFQLDPLREIGMVTRIAGTDSIAVKELAIRDRSSGKDLVFKAFGTVGDPREEVTQGLSMPELAIARPSTK